MTITVEILSQELASLKKEIESLKLQVISGKNYPEKKIVSLKGALKGMRIDDDEISEAKKSLFKGD